MVIVSIAIIAVLLFLIYLNDDNNNGKRLMPIKVKVRKNRK